MKKKKKRKLLRSNVNKDWILIISGSKIFFQALWKILKKTVTRNTLADRYEFQIAKPISKPIDVTKISET